MLKQAAGLMVNFRKAGQISTRRTLSTN